MQARDVSDQIHEPRRTTWAWWIILVVVIAFGIFWYSEQSKDIAPVVSPISSTSSQTSLDSLQAAVIESEIPDYSQEF